MSVNLSPLSLSPQAKDIDLSVLLGLASGNPILSQKIAALVNSGFKSDSTHVTITGLVLNPPGVTSGPAVLDQFKNVKITLPLSGSTAPNSVAVKGPPLVDTSALIPANPLSSLAMSPSQINIDTLPRSILSLAAQLDYDNSLPLSVTIPFIQTSVSVNDVELVQPTLRGIALHNGKHSMRPNLALYFQQTDATVQDHVANLVSRLQSGTPPDSKVSVNGVLFGGNGENDRNDLFGFVTLDVSKMLDGLKLPSQSLTLPSSSSDGSGLAPTIHGVSFSVLPQKTLALTASAQISLSLPLTANINTLQAGLKLDSDPYLVTSLTGLSLKNGTSDMKLGVNLQFIEMDQTPAKVALLADAAMKGKDVKTRVDLYGVSLGFSSEDQIRTFSRISFGLPMTTLFKQLSKPAASNSTSTSMAVPKLDVNPTKLDVTFEPGQIVSASAGAQMKLPFPVDVSVPFVALGVALDKTPALRPSVTGFTVSRSQENNANETLSVTAHLAIQDSDALTNKIGEITDAVIKGQKTDKSLSIDGFTIGASVEDAIQSFKLVSVDLGIDSLLASSQQKSELTGGAVASSISASFIDAVKLGSVDVSTHQGQSVLVNVNAAFNNHLQVSLTGLNHLAFGAGIDATPLVLTRLSGIQMKPGDNNMELKTALQFVPGRESQVKFATFMNDVMTKNATTLEQMVGVSGFQIGVSETDYIRAFSKAKLGLKASQLLSQGLHGPGLGGSGSSDLLKSLVINENNVDFSTPGAITIDIGVGLKNFSLPVSASVGYTGVSTDLNDAGLADLSVHNLKVSHTDGTLDVSCRVEIDIKGDDAIKKRVALLAKTILTKGLGEADVTARVYNFGLGASQSDLIETFSLIDVKGNPLKLIPKPDSIDKRGEKADMLKVDLITAELIDSRRIGAEVKSRVLGLPPIKLNLPYFSVAGHLDDGDFLEIEGKDINLDNGNLTMYGIMYTHKNLEAAQKLAYIVGNVLFHRPQTVPNNVSISNIRFGASKERSFKILDMIQLGAPMAPAIDGVTKVLDNPASYIELTEMKSTLVPTGISASFIGKPFPGGIPLATKPGFSATAKIGYGPNGIQEIVNIFFGDILAQPGQPFTGKADIHVRVPEILDALRENVPNLFTWKNYDQNITVGWPVMMAGDPHSPVIQFDPFDQIVIEAPPLYLYTPLTFEPHLVNPFKDGLGLDIDVYIPNPGPLFADFGFLTTTVYHNNDTIAQITTAEAVVIKNRANGGDKFGVNKIRLQNRIKLSKNPLKAWGELTDMMRNFKNYRVDIVASTPEYGRLDWLTTCFQHVPEFMTGKIAPLMIALLSHVKVPNHLYS